jgi:uncharacterized protein (TIGR03032 family)
MKPTVPSTTEASVTDENQAAPAAPAQSPTPQLALHASRQFVSWLEAQKVSLAFTTYQAGKLFLIGTGPDGRMSIFERSFERCMGLAGSDQTLWMSSIYQLWRFENVIPPGEAHDGYDRLYVPQMSFVTGDIDVHDIALDDAGEPIFVNTLFSCLARPSTTHSFAPVWQPPFITRLAAEDRCHLNGLALRDGKPAYVTLVGKSDVADGWREHRRGGGMVLDVATGEPVLTGLSMPHSPRWHDGKLWLLNSGAGEFGFADLAAGTFEPVAFCPGYARGLTIVGHFAVIGLSRPRPKTPTFEGLALGERLKEKGAEARCGLHVVDLRTGDATAWLRIEGVVEELYDVIVLPGVRRPQALGFKTDEIKRVIRIGA